MSSIVPGAPALRRLAAWRSLFVWRRGRRRWYAIFFEGFLWVMCHISRLLTGDSATPLRQDFG